ncbi:hypothetical protein CBR_g41214 [Chara braunii]|uniref:Uncharacterized protein n=1 Tax=Chara braunii TaxID=69332 RepID=A0A388K2Q1_CHABU|nr:hypothetical protein CBR_g41214 [Chara braunii]|eukprot:GBG64295.1 hypothetical protein CBR_g41214 [Chara braunii]
MASTSRAAGQPQITIVREGVCHGIILWIDWMLDQDGSFVLSGHPTEGRSNRFLKQEVKLLKTPLACKVHTQLDPQAVTDGAVTDGADTTKKVVNERPQDGSRGAIDGSSVPINGSKGAIYGSRGAIRDADISSRDEWLNGAGGSDSPSSNDRCRHGFREDGRCAAMESESEKLDVFAGATTCLDVVIRVDANTGNLTIHVTPETS